MTGRQLRDMRMRVYPRPSQQQVSKKAGLNGTAVFVIERHLLDTRIQKDVTEAIEKAIKEIESATTEEQKEDDP